MPGIRILIVENDLTARRHLRGLLSLDPESKLAGECGSGAEAMRLLEQRGAEIVFADTEAPEMNGFEISRAVSGSKSLVILTSRRSDHALRAFDARAFDYLLKPIQEKRFESSLGRAKAEVSRRIMAAARAARMPERIAVRQSGRVLFIRADDIDWIEAADNYLVLHCGGKTHMLRETMSQAEARLCPAHFARIHRSAIVNTDRIRELRRWFRGDYQVILHDGTRLTLTKSHRARLDELLLLGSFG